MKVLVLNDCLSTNAGAVNLLKSVCDGIAAPHEIDWVNIHDLDMNPCQKCLKCLPCGECVLPEDDAHKIGRKLFVSDALVVGVASVPTNVSVTFEILLDRCASALSFENRQGETRSWRKGRKAIIASCGKTVNMKQLPTKKADARRYPLLAALGKGGFDVIGNVAQPAKDCSSIEEGLINQARELGGHLFCNMLMAAPA